MQFICEHAGEPVTVSDVAEYVLVSQRTLHRKFAQVLGRTPAAEIRRARVDLAKRLLLTTELPFLRVAMDAGFVSQAQMCRYIKTDTGLTPTQLRYRDRTLVGGT